MSMIGLVGKAGCGKSSVARYLQNEYGYTVYPMAYAIRKSILTALPFVKAEYLQEDKEKVIPELGCTGRKLLQSLGHDWGRKSIHEDVWVRAQQAMFEILKVDVSRAVIDDVRYTNEGTWIKRNKGVIIEIDRPFMDTSGKFRQHESENSFDSDLIDHTIRNVSCYHPDLEAATDHILSKIHEDIFA
jgi:hypothetical protein